MNTKLDQRTSIQIPHGFNKPYWSESVTLEKGITA